MNLKTLAITAIVCCSVGMLFFLIQRNLLIIRFSFDPSSLNIQSQKLQTQSIKKTIRVFYKKNDTWHHEETSVIWDDAHSSQNLINLIKQWLCILHSEKILPRVSLESVALSQPGSEAYASFDRSLFNTEWSIIQKWSIIESLFKTIHHANIPIHTMTFLIDNTIMHDDHLDFSQSLPIQERL